MRDVRQWVLRRLFQEYDHGGHGSGIEWCRPIPLARARPWSSGASRLAVDEGPCLAGASLHYAWWL